MPFDPPSDYKVKPFRACQYKPRKKKPKSSNYIRVRHLLRRSSEPLFGYDDRTGAQWRTGSHYVHLYRETDNTYTVEWGNERGIIGYEDNITDLDTADSIFDRRTSEYRLDEENGDEF